MPITVCAITPTTCRRRRIDMTETTLNPHHFMTLGSAATAVKAAGAAITHNVLGPPGVGKTAILSQMADEMGMPFLFIDGKTIDISDFGVYAPNEERTMAKWLPNQKYVHLTEKPHVIGIDEMSKASPPVLNALHTALHGYPKCIGDTVLHPETVVVCTGNLGSDGLGDRLQAHTANRMVTLYVKANFDDFWDWGIQTTNGVGGPGLHPVILIMSKQVPRLFENYWEANTDSNAFIFNPKIGRTSGFFSPRSAEQASTVLLCYERTLEEKGLEHGARDAQEHREVLRAQLTGCVGASCMEQIMTFYDLNDQIVMKEDILADPDNCQVPPDPAAQGFIINNALGWVEADEVDTFVKYLVRFPAPEQECFLELAQRKWEGEDRHGRLFTNKQVRDIYLELNGRGHLKATVGTAKDRI
jgi:hypothetical protein